VLGRGCRLHVVVGRKEVVEVISTFQIMCKQSHMTLLITFILDLMVIQVNTEGVLLK